MNLSKALLGILIVGVVAIVYWNMLGASLHQVSKNLAPANSEQGGVGHPSPHQASVKLSSSPREISREKLCAKIWRYDLKCALYYALSPDNLRKVKELANKLRGETEQQSVWNILSWEDEHIHYNFTKAKESPPKVIIWSNGTVKVEGNRGYVIQTPYETVLREAGICTDYALLTDALLLDMGFRKVYLFELSFENDPVGHVVAGVRLDGEYFLLDQHPPPMNMRGYYDVLAHCGILGVDRRTRIISKAQVFEIRFNGSSVQVRSLGNLSGNVFLSNGYVLGAEDLKNLRRDLSALLRAEFHLIEDPNVKSLEGGSLPTVYVKGIEWSLKLPCFARYYTRTFHKQLVEMIFNEMISNKKLVNYLKSYKYYWMDLSVKEGDLVIKLILAKK